MSLRTHGADSDWSPESGAEASARVSERAAPGAHCVRAVRRRVRHIAGRCSEPQPRRRQRGQRADRGSASLRQEDGGRSCAASALPPPAAAAAPLGAGVALATCGREPRVARVRSLPLPLLHLPHSSARASRPRPLLPLPLPAAPRSLLLSFPPPTRPSTPFSQPAHSTPSSTTTTSPPPTRQRAVSSPRAAAASFSPAALARCTAARAP